MNLEILKSNDLPMRDKVNALEVAINDHPLANKVEMKLEHIFSDGIYARKLYIPKDMIVVGKIHKYTNLNFMVKGVMDVLVGEQIKRIIAPFEVVSPPNTKRIAHAIEDTIWITILRTDEVNIDKIEDDFTCNSEEEFLKFCYDQKKQLTLALD